MCECVCVSVSCSTSMSYMSCTSCGSKEFPNFAASAPEPHSRGNHFGRSLKAAQVPRAHLRMKHICKGLVQAMKRTASMQRDAKWCTVVLQWHRHPSQFQAKIGGCLEQPNFPNLHLPPLRKRLQVSGVHPPERSKST